MPERAGEREPRHEIERQPLSALAKRGALWTITGHGARQAMRLGGNLVLTRLLFPEAFGLMAIVQVVLRGLEMFSAVGVNASVIRDKRGDEPAYLNTAWTISLVRGGVLWVIAALLAWPAAVMYDEPRLLLMLPVAALSSPILGAASTAVLRLQRHVHLRPIVLREIYAAAGGLVATLALALALKSVWALILGNLVGACLKTALSYWMLPGPRPQLHWDKSAAGEIYRFGRWIFVGTALTFFVQQGDKAILGTLVDPDVLGVYSIALMLSRAPLEILLKLNGQLLFPLYARIAITRPTDLRDRVWRARKTLLALFLPFLWALIFFGRELIDLMYDPRYVEAGWMLQWLALGTCGSAVTVTAGGVLLAVGDSFRHMILQIYRGTALLGCIGLGYHFGGIHGLVAGVAAARFLEYPVLAWAVRKHGAWLPRLDALAYGLTLLVVLIAMLTGQFGLAHHV